MTLYRFPTDTQVSEIIARPTKDAADLTAKVSQVLARIQHEGDSAVLEYERQFDKGIVKFRKPISCSLYPIRVVRLGGGRIGLNLHRWDICRCAFEKGRREGIRVYEFLRGPLTEAFGEEFYSALSAAAKICIAAS